MAETAHFQSDGGAVWEMDLPLPEVMQDKVTKGYLRRVNADGSAYTEGPPPERPADSASKAAWVGWAVAQGAAPEAADGMTKADLIEKYGTSAA